MSAKELDYALISWIKKDLEERRLHQEKMAKKNHREDDIFTRMLSTLEKLKLKRKEMILVKNFINHKNHGKNFTPSQRSVITSIFYKYLDHK